MKTIKAIICIFFTASLFAQSNIEIFLFDLERKHSEITLSNAKILSENEGYDNQPSFLDDRYIVFASSRHGQTDISKYDTHHNSKDWVNFTKGGEYSPLKIPNKQEVSAVRLDEDGKQRLYSYNLSDGVSTELIKDLVVAYYTWFDDDTIVSAVIEDEELNLYVSRLKSGTNTKYASNVGRSFHRIPNSNLVSFISKENENQWQIKSLNPETGVIKPITNTIKNIEDICWLDRNTLLSGKHHTLYQFKLEANKDWETIANLSSYGITEISRLSVNSSASKLLIAGDIATLKNDALTYNETKLESKLDRLQWISGSWHGEAFGGITEEIWSEPSGGSMMASFKLITDGKVTFYEIMVIREIENTLILQLKHFGPDLKAWEAKDETIDFPLKEITENNVIFEGMRFEKISNIEMNVYVNIKNDDGKVEEVKFNYKKKL